MAVASQLAHGRLRMDVGLQPFHLAIMRDGVPLLPDIRFRAVPIVVRDRFLRVTEGVLPGENEGPAERLLVAELAGESCERSPERLPAAQPAGASRERLELVGALQGGRLYRLDIALPAPDRVTLRFSAEGDGLRLAARWPAAPGEALAGLGARHHPAVDHAGRRIELGADRRYLGPDCPEELRQEGGIPQGDYAPVPFLTSSAGWAAWLRTEGPGARFDLTSDIEVSARGPLHIDLFLPRTPLARLRRYTELTGRPQLLPEWGYGFWKSRDVYPHQDDVLDDLHGHRWHGIPLDAIVIDSPWETQYNTWAFNPRQFPDPRGMIARLRRAGVRTVVWITPWVNVDSADAIGIGQCPPDAASERALREPAANWEEGARSGHFARDDGGETLLARWWMGRGSLVDFTSSAAEAWWRGHARRVLELGVEGIKADDGEGYYLPPDARLADGRTGAEAAWAYGGLYRRSMRRALDETHPGRGVLFGRCGWAGQQRDGVLWGGDQTSDFWSLRALVAALIGAAHSAFSNLSHDVGGYLGERLVRRCPPELLVRWAQVGCFTPLMQAHGRLQQEPWTYDPETRALYRAYVLLHERLVPYVRAAAATAARTGLPVIRPLPLLDPADRRGWSVGDAYGYGPALWVAPVLEEGARERTVALPRGRWIDAWTGERVPGGGEVTVPAPVARIPVWVREGSLIVTYPEAHVAAGVGDVPEHERPLEATLWGEPPLGRATARLADGTSVRCHRGKWSVEPERELTILPPR